MTRILHIISSADPRHGGPIEGTRRFSEIWVRDGHQADMLTLDPPEASFLEDFPGRIINLGPPSGRSPQRIYRFSPKMTRWLKNNAAQYDAIIVSGIWRYQARAARVALAGRDIPYFVFTHGMLDPWFRERSRVKNMVKQISWMWAEGALLRHAANVFFTTEDERVLAEDSFWPYHVNAKVVGYGTNDVTGNPDQQILAFRKAVPHLGSRRFLLFLSRIHPKKGCDLLIDAFAKIASSEPDLDLVIAGPDQVGLMAELQSRVESLGIHDRVHFPGMLMDDVKVGAFRSAEAFVLSSHQENFGIVVAEAMACKTPVLISNKVNIWREVLEDGAGLVEPDTLEGTVKLLSQFLKLSDDERTAMGSAGRESFLKRFHVEHVARTQMAIMESRIAEMRGVRGNRIL